jgi:regulator of protease activity HflC (stomatin/prohibitin superfamily)
MTMKKGFKRLVVLMILLAMPFMFGGCFGGCWGAPVSDSQVGLIMKDGASISQVVATGRYKDWGMLSDIKIISTAAITGDYTDASVLLRDKQQVSVTLAYTVRRAGDTESIKRMWSTYKNEALSDDLLKQLVLKYIPEGLKAATTSMTLDETLGISNAAGSGRDAMTTKIEENVRPKLKECGIDLVDIRLSDIQPSASYLASLDQKANSQAQIDVANAEVKEAEAKRQAELTKKQTELEVAQLENILRPKRIRSIKIARRLMSSSALNLLQKYIMA